jgi:acetylornithine/N-succinyldiaminopimelate aminotransferase
MAEKHLQHNYNRFPVAFVRGKGIRLFDEKGEEYLDLISGLGVNVLGHSHNVVVKTIAEQAENILHTSNLYRILPQEGLAERIAKHIRGARSFFLQ